MYSAFIFSNLRLKMIQIGDVVVSFDVLREKFLCDLNACKGACCVEGDAGTEKLVQFIRTWCDLKLWHVQFNVVNKSTLLAAQKDPQKYRNLIVRIAGYSAYFVDLSPDLQNDLIARTGHDQM